MRQVLFGLIGIAALICFVVGLIYHYNPPATWFVGVGGGILLALSLSEK